MAVFLVVGAAAVLAVVVVLVLALQFSERIARTASVVSVLTSVLTAVWMVWTAVELIGSDRLTVTVPVTVLPPRVDPGVVLQPSQATILSGGFDRATVEVTGLSLPVRLTLLASVLVAGATLIGVALVVRRLARSLDDGDPFTVGSTALLSTAFLVLVGGIFASVLGDLGSWRASVEAFSVDGWSGPSASGGDDLTAMGWPEPAGLTLTLPFWPFGAGLVLALLAGVFRHGARLRKDAEGLV